MVVGTKLSVTFASLAPRPVERRPPRRIRASLATDAAAPQLPPCLRWRAKQARLTQVARHIRTLEKAIAPSTPELQSSVFAVAFWYTPALDIVRALTRRQRAAERPALLHRLAALQAEAQALDRAVLRERIASLAAPEATQMQALSDPQRPTSYFAPQLATFFAAQALSDTGVAEAYLASLELVACDYYLAGMQAGKVIEGVTFDTIKEQARQAGRVCDCQLNLLATQGDAFYDLCTRHAEAIKHWQRHFKIA